MKKVIKVSVILFSFFLAFKSYSQEKSNVILGTWKAIDKDTSGFDDKTIDGKPIEVDLSIKIYENTIDVNENGIEYNNLDYKIVESSEPITKLILFGNRRYSIIKLSDKEMIWKQDDVFSTEIFFVRRD